MNRLQKKCLIFTAGFHLLLLVILVVGPGFFEPKPKYDDMPILTAIPSHAVDAALSSGVQGAQPPPPVTQPVVTPPPQPRPQLVVTPPPPTPTPSVMEKIEKYFKPEPTKPEPKLTPDELTPKEKPVKPKEHKVEISLNEVHKTIKSQTTDDSQAQADARERKRLKNEKLRALAEARNEIEKNASSSTVIDMPGNSSVAYANYGQIVKSIYDRAWTAPDNADNDNANTKVKVVISRDGTVISADIIDPSGDAAVDRSVQRALDKVHTIDPFPDDSTDQTRTYIINFNLKSKRMLG